MYAHSLKFIWRSWVDELQSVDSIAADNEDGGETGGIAGVLGTNVAAMGILMGSTTTDDKIMVIRGSRQGDLSPTPKYTKSTGTGQIVDRDMTKEVASPGPPKRPPHWNDMTRSQKSNWRKRN